MSKEDNQQGLLERFVPILLLASIGLAFAVGVLWQKVNSLESGSSPTAGTVANNNNAAAGAQPANAGLAQGKLTPDKAEKLPKVSDTDRLRGSRSAKVTVIEYSDFECPFCARFHETMVQVQKEYGDQVAWVYRHFPLDQLHPKARPAAIASECIANLGGNDAFWKFADNVFAAQQTVLADLPKAAGDAGVNTASFNTCFNAKQTEDRVNSDYQAGQTAGVTGTPGNFVVNAKGDVWFIPGALPFDQVKVIVDEALKA